MTTRRSWELGRCPCCGGALCEYIDGTEPEAIGEGVMLCGRCVAMEHHWTPGLVPALLEAIVLGDDGPINRLLDAVRP